MGDLSGTGQPRLGAGAATRRLRTYATYGFPQAAPTRDRVQIRQGFEPECAESMIVLHPRCAFAGLSPDAKGTDWEGGGVIFLGFSRAAFAICSPRTSR